jgi:predicted RNA-binding protein
MCQAKIYLVGDGNRQMVAEDVISLEETPEGVRFATFFEEPKVLRARVVAVDFLKHIVTLEPLEAEATDGN